MKGGGEALFIGVVAPSGSDGAPDVDFRLGAFFQPVDVLAVRPDEQCGDDEREDDERHRVVDFGRQQHEDRKTASRDHRRERHVVRNHQHDEPDTEAEQDAQHVGGAGVAASVFADVDAVIFLTDPHRIGNRSQQVGYKYHGDSTVICQDHR